MSWTAGQLLPMWRVNSVVVEVGITTSVLSRMSLLLSLMTNWWYRVVGEKEGE